MEQAKIWIFLQSPGDLFFFIPAQLLFSLFTGEWHYFLLSMARLKDWFLPCHLSKSKELSKAFAKLSATTSTK
jgi:hypothetical protein